MNKVLSFLKKLAFRICQISGVCLLSALAQSAAASPDIALGSVPEVFEVRIPPANLPKPKPTPNKVPDHLRLKFDRNFMHGLV